MAIKQANPTIPLTDQDREALDDIFEKVEVEVRFVPVQTEDYQNLKSTRGKVLSHSYRLKHNLDNLIAVMVKFHPRRCSGDSISHPEENEYQIGEAGKVRRYIGT